VTVFAAKSYWPGITEDELARAATRAVREAADLSRAGTAVTYLGAILFADDALVLCMFEGHSPAAVKEASERAGIPCERTMESLWLAPPKPERSPTCPITTRPRWPR
jgi:hypothetical protein